MGVVQRLPGADDVLGPHDGQRHPVTAQGDGDRLGEGLGLPEDRHRMVGVVLARRGGSGRRAARPAERGPVVAAFVASLAVDRPRADEEHRDAVAHRELRGPPGAVDVDPVVPVHLVHRLGGSGLGGEVHERLDPTHLRRGVAPGPPVGHVTDDHCAGEGRAGRLGVGVHLAVQDVEGRDVEAQVDQPQREPLAEKAGAAAEQHGHAGPRGVVRARSRPTRCTVTLTG